MLSDLDYLQFFIMIAYFPLNHQNISEIIIIIFNEEKSSFIIIIAINDKNQSKIPLFFIFNFSKLFFKRAEKI